jgi:integrase
MKQFTEGISSPQQTEPDTRNLVSKPRRKPGKKKVAKPPKPYPDFPLFPHATKRWAKKIRGKLYYFGPWDSWQAALEKYQQQRDDLYAGRRPVDPTAFFTVEKLVNKFLLFKRSRVDSDELTARSFAEYYATCQRVLDAFGWNRAVEDVRPDDFERYRAQCAKKWGPHRLSGEVQRVRSLFKYAFEAGCVDKMIRYGPGFKKPTKQRMRQHRAAGEKKLFTREEVQKLLDAAGVQLKAMIFLGLNGGFGNHDCGMLPLSALDLDAGWIDFARPKTAIQRRFPLWPETVQALREVLAKRPIPKEPDAEGRVFVTKYGGCWAKKTELTETKDGKPVANTDNPVSKEMRKVLNELKINGRRNFYTLRHMAETIGGESRDQVAVDAIMGHVDPGMGAVYREGVSDERLRAVTEHIRTWLFGAAKE